MPGPKAPGTLERSQKQLYVAVRKELAPFETLKRRELLDYERAFRQGLPRKARASSRRELLAAIKGASVVLVGDFHPFRQAQKGFTRLVESAAKSRGQAAIALECFEQKHQRSLDQYIAGLITAEELRDETNFDASWAFPWENYREILLLARGSRFPLIALNVRGKLRARDSAAATRIARQLSAQSGVTVFALFGELHLGRAHLPRALRLALGARVSVVLVHQNDPEVYWRAPTLKDGQKSEVVRLGPAEFCVLNSVPWVKLRSYLDWLEGSPSPDFEDEQFDVTGMIHHYAGLLAQATGLSAKLDQTVEVLPPDRLSRRSPLLRGLLTPDQELLTHSLAMRRTGYLPRRALIALPTVSTNSLLEAATYLLRHTARCPLAARARWDSEETTAHFLVGYLGSKLLNPKRKCDEVIDLQRRASARDLFAARALALLRAYLKRKKIPRKPLRLSIVQEQEAARAAGFVLGERAFRGLLRSPKGLETIRDLLKTPESPSLLHKVTRIIAKAGLAPASKREKF